MQVLGLALLIVAIRPGRRFARWRQPSVRVAIKRMTLMNALAWFAFAVVIGGAVVRATWHIPPPGEDLAAGFSEGVSWRFSVTEVSHLTCLQIIASGAGRAEACGRPTQPRAALSAVRLAVGSPDSGGPQLHFLAGTIPRDIETLHVNGEGIGIAIPSRMFIRSDRFPFSFFVMNVRRTVGAVTVNGVSGTGRLVASVNVPPRPRLSPG